MNDRERILELLADGPFPALKLLTCYRHRSWKHAIHDLEHEGKIWRNWDGYYELR